jgi:hypothetical protein
VSGYRLGPNYAQVVAMGVICMQFLVWGVTFVHNMVRSHGSAVTITVLVLVAIGAGRRIQ